MLPFDSRIKEKSYTSIILWPISFWGLRVPDNWILTQIFPCLSNSVYQLLKCHQEETFQLTRNISSTQLESLGRLT